MEGSIHSMVLAEMATLFLLVANRIVSTVMDNRIHREIYRSMYCTWLEPFKTKSDKTASFLVLQFFLYAIEMYVPTNQFATW